MRESLLCEDLVRVLLEAVHPSQKRQAEISPQEWQQLQWSPRDQILLTPAPHPLLSQREVYVLLSRLRFKHLD
jgi:hypothetical protein